MPNYRRNYVPGGTYFFTVVTHQRRPLFERSQTRGTLREAIQEIHKKRPFTTVALVLLPDHLHAIWTLPEGDTDYSTRWRQIKEAFTRSFPGVSGQEGDLSASRIRKSEGAVWQRRFWEHTCKDQDDLNRCIDYIHWNPVKHGLVPRVRDYPWSTFHRYVKESAYSPDWGSENPCPGYDAPEWE
jgi:putative transposase